MKQPKRILAYSALALIVMLAAFGAIAFDTSERRPRPGSRCRPRPPSPRQDLGATTINLSWNTVDDASTTTILWVVGQCLTSWQSASTAAAMTRSVQLTSDQLQPYRSHQRHHLLLPDPCRK